MGMWNLLVDGFMRPGVKVAAGAVGKVVQDAKGRADVYKEERNAKQSPIRAEKEQAILKADCARIREYAERFGWEGRSDDDEIIEKIEKIRETAVDMKDLAFINQIYSRACKRSLRGMDRCNSMIGRRYTLD